MSQVVKNNRGFLQFLAVCPAHQRQFLLRTASPKQLHALVQVLYNILKEYILIPEENKRNVLPYKDALVNLAETNVPYKTKKRILVQEGDGFIQDLLVPALFEYVLLPHNNEVTKPRALNTFLDGLAELGIDKGLIKNKKLLSDLIEKEKGYRNVENTENTSDNESNNEESSSDIENQEEEEEVASENGVEAEGTQESDNDTENDSEEAES
ncbi:unnamed protein product, partial [Porites lobata]